MNLQQIEIELSSSLPKLNVRPQILCPLGGGVAGSGDRVSGSGSNSNAFGIYG